MGRFLTSLKLARGPSRKSSAKLPKRKRSLTVEILEGRGLLSRALQSFALRFRFPRAGIWQFGHQNA